MVTPAAAKWDGASVCVPECDPIARLVTFAKSPAEMLSSERIAGGLPLSQMCVSGPRGTVMS